MTEGQKWTHILCLTLGVWIPAMALCRAPRAPAGGSPCPRNVSSSATCFLLSRHKIRQGLKMFLLPKFIIAPLQGDAMVSQLKSFRKKINKGLEITSSCLQKFQVHIRQTLSFQCLSKNLFLSKPRGSICSPSCTEFLLSPQWHKWWMKKNWNKIPFVQSYMVIMLKNH